MANQFGDQKLLVVNIHLDATTAVDRAVWSCPSLGTAYRLAGINYAYGTAGGASAALRPRKITDTSAPGATASSTVIELTAAFDLTATANTVRTPSIPATDAQRTFKPGDRLTLDASGTLTGLAGLAINFYFEPVARYV
jgi:hypothetical protein